MPDIKLARIPDRTPVKLTISVAPDLSVALADYAALYQEAYGQTEQVADLVPYMLRAFLDSDRSFCEDAASRHEELTACAHPNALALDRANAMVITRYRRGPRLQYRGPPPMSCRLPVSRLQ